MAYNKDWFPARRQLAMAGTWARVLLSPNPPRFGVPAAEATTWTRRELMKPPLTGKDLPHSRWTRRRADLKTAPVINRVLTALRYNDTL